MLVPVMLIMGPTHAKRASGSTAQNAVALATEAGGSLPPLAPKRSSASGNDLEAVGRKRACTKGLASPSCGVLTSHAGTHKKRGQSHYHTRSSSRLIQGDSVITDELQSSDTAALTLLADAALMDL
jgi:hypothetical protein